MDASPRLMAPTQKEEPRRDKGLPHLKPVTRVGLQPQPRNQDLRLPGADAAPGLRARHAASGGGVATCGRGWKRVSTQSACASHPRLAVLEAAKSWVAGPSPAMTQWQRPCMLH